MAAPVNKTPQPPPYSNRTLHDMETERKRDDDERLTGWAVIWTLFAFKMFTVGLIWYVAHGSSDASHSNGLLVVTTWYWLLIPVIAVSGFVAYRLRLRSARKRASELKQAEFMASHPAPMTGTAGSDLTDEEKERLRALQARRERREG